MELMRRTAFNVIPFDSVTGMSVDHHLTCEAYSIYGRVKHVGGGNNELRFISWKLTKQELKFEIFS